jgi:hypothetical protein
LIVGDIIIAHAEARYGAGIHGIRHGILMFSTNFTEALTSIKCLLQVSGKQKKSLIFHSAGAINTGSSGN